MLLRLPDSLHYPIRITKIEKFTGEPVEIDDRLFLYTYKTKRQEGSRHDDEERWVEREFATHFGSTLAGTISSWRVWVGDVIEAPVDICEVEEVCRHEIQFNGMCANCGVDVTRLRPGSASDIDRAPIRMAHDTPLLSISQDEAAKIDEESKQRLLADHKLSLVVDLDQTIIHAAVDPTIGEWQKDPQNPNYDAVKDVRSFQLLDDGPGMRGCWYYIKLRPGLQEFLENISQLYELHIYTMGTRQYAKQISDIVDPQHKFFGDRILSRDESGSMIAKNLERLFPIDTKMVVIIDDRGDVWKWSANLIRVTPFDFFVGIGDINSSFLPKKQEIQATIKEPKAVVAVVEEPTGYGEAANGLAEDGTSSVQNGTSALENLIAMSGSNDAVARQEQTDSQEKTISTQLEEKPLEKMQREQDEKDDAEAGTVPEPNTSNGTLSTNGETSAPPLTNDSDSDSTDSDSGTPKRHRHSILKDDDEELIHLEAALTAVHSAFFKEWDRRRISGKGGRVAALTGQRKAPLPETDTNDDPSPANLTLVPDIKRIMPAMKVRILSSVVIVFSGVLPLGTDIQSADISTWAKTFGATIREEVGKDVTHVIAARAGTAKVKRAVKRGIKVVSTTWLFESMQRWRKLDERPYLLEGAGRPESVPSSSPTRTIDDTGFGSITSELLLSDSEDTDPASDADDDNAPQHQQSRKRLRLDTAEIPDASTNSEDEEYTPPTLNKEEYDRIQEELREFMGSDMDSESDAESVRSELSVRNKKRRRTDDDDQDESDSLGNPVSNDPNDEDDSSPPSKSLRTAQKSSAGSGGSRLRTVTTTTAKSLSPDQLAAERDAELSDRRQNDRIRQEQESAEQEDWDRQRQESDTDQEDQRELEEMLGGSDSEDTVGEGLEGEAVQEGMGFGDLGDE